MSLDRLTQFLQNTELLDVYTPESGSNVIGLQNPARDSIGLKNARFTWDRDAKDEDSVASSTRKFCLRIEDELVFENGTVNLIIGPTGCGKTSLLMALLGEMHYSPTASDSWFNLPRENGVAYAAQESWVLNETIKVRLH